MCNVDYSLRDTRWLNIVNKFRWLSYAPRRCRIPRCLFTSIDERRKIITWKSRTRRLLDQKNQYLVPMTICERKLHRTLIFQSLTEECEKKRSYRTSLISTQSTIVVRINCKIEISEKIFFPFAFSFRFFQIFLLINFFLIRT